MKYVKTVKRTGAIQYLIDSVYYDKPARYDTIVLEAERSSGTIETPYM